MTDTAMTQRYGGELAQGVDPLAAQPTPLGDDVLGFSHGRAALAWYLDAHAQISWVMHCAYICPTVPAFFARRGLLIETFDVGACGAGIADRAALQKGPGVVLIPALFGRDPWLDVNALAQACGPNVHVVIDAAQTAFGHEDYAPPTNGAVLSCPRKACALGGGAFLRMDVHVTPAERKSVDALALAQAPVMNKRKARSLFGTGNLEDEMTALDCVEQCERSWPDTPHRIDEQDLRLFEMIDGDEHRRRRRVNSAQLQARLAHSGVEFIDERAGTKGVPFNLPVLLPATLDRRQMLASLRARRVFATPLWPDCDVDPVRHRLATTYRARLLALPIDQRFDRDDIDEIANRFMSCLLN